MSDPSLHINAMDRLDWHGPLRNMAGTTVTASPDNWPFGTLNTCVRYDEDGLDVAGNCGFSAEPVITGSDDDGTASSSYQCAQSGRSYATTFGSNLTVGHANRTNGQWFEASSFN